MNNTFRATPGSRSGGRLLRQMSCIALILASSGLLTGGADAAERAQPIKIGVLTESWGPTPEAVGLRDGLVELGYRENEQFVLGVRFTQGDLTALPAAAHELIQYGVDIIFACYNAATKAAQGVTTRIPIVFAGVADPVGLGLIQNFARPGGNITGVADLHFELSPKRLELFHEIIPGLKRVLYLYDAADADAVAGAKLYHDAAHRLDIALVEQPVRTVEETQAILARVSKDEVDGILAPRQGSLNIIGFIMEITSQRAIPTMFDASFMVEQGALASYGPNLHETGRQAARLIDKILKGADPAETPVEANSKVEFVINLKVAKTLGLTIAPEVLYRADRIIR
ncbi:MAG: ABC transporter substrate-binding protein [Deltaproteobacteria bacterium]|nr:ABC transporter substrate-binding protein [Deltaproteobacteria bacterium]